MTFNPALISLICKLVMIGFLIAGAIFEYRIQTMHQELIETQKELIHSLQLKLGGKV